MSATGFTLSTVKDIYWAQRCPCPVNYVVRPFVHSLLPITPAMISQSLQDRIKSQQTFSGPDLSELRRDFFTKTIYLVLPWLSSLSSHLDDGIPQMMEKLTYSDQN